MEGRPPTAPADSVAAYQELLEELKVRIQDARVRASLAVNSEMILLYWRVGRCILERQHEQGWGSKVIDRLSADLRAAFPDVAGYSTRNLKYMRAFAQAYPRAEIVQGVLAQITWYHNIALLDKVKSAQARSWYARRAAEYGWSRDALVHWIESGLYEREGRALTNFDRTLAPSRSDLARELVKDPYHFVFLGLGAEARERDIERALLQHLRDFLLELGVGFAFLGSQHRLQVGGQDYRLDLLFYHVRLRCYVAVELKLGAFTPE